MVLRFEQKEVTDNYHCPFESMCAYSAKWKERNPIYWTYEGVLMCKALKRHAPKDTRCSYMEILKALLKRDIARVPTKPVSEADDEAPRNTLMG